MDQDIKKEFDDLGRIVKGGFDDVTKDISEIKIDITDLKGDVKEVKKDVKDLKSTLTTQYPTKSFLTEALAKLGDKIDEKTTKDLRFKIKVIELFKRLNVSGEDISELEAMIELKINNHVSR